MVNLKTQRDNSHPFFYYFLLCVSSLCDLCASVVRLRFVSMKAIVKKKSEPGLWLEDVPTPKIGINDVLIQVLRTGICGTDLHIYKWDAWAQKTIPVPLVVGHEFVGRVVEV